MTLWVRTGDELQRLVASLKGCRRLGLDSESDSFHHHFEKVCLLQLASDRGEAWLIDTLALRDLSPLSAIIADPAVVKVLHGADYDVTTLKRDFGFRFETLFDTMVAARFLGLVEFSLQALARSELGVALSKDSQRDDWSRRPLTAAQEAYALADVAHLLALHARLAARLQERGRLDWVLEECAAVAALPPARRQPDPDAWQKIKGVRRLAPRALCVLRELHGWRQRRAEATDLPAFRILGNEALLALSEKAPRTAFALGELRGVPTRLRKEPGALLEAIERGLRAQPAVIPRPPRPVTDEAFERRTRALKAWRAQEATRADLEVAVVLPQRLIDRLAEAAPRDRGGLEAIDGLRRWRIDTYAAALLAALS